MNLPPSYSASTSESLPDYSSDPAQNERRIAYQRRPHYDPEPDGLYIQKEDKVTLVLTNQRHGASLPEYNRRSVISGSIILDDPRSIEELKIELKCRVEFLTLSHGFLSREINRISQLLYSKEQTGAECPSSVPLSCPFPSTYKCEGTSYSLPPTYNETLYAENAQYARVSHSLNVVVTKTRNRKAVAVLGKNKRMFSAALNYRPRSRPQRPIPCDYSFLSTIKVCPEEWQQSVTTIEPRFPGPNSPQSISCQLFLPSVGVFDLNGTIPFHVQLASSTATLSRLCQGDNKHPPIKVSLGRQLLLDMGDRKVPIVFNLGQGKIALSPDFRSGPSHQEAVLNFEGHVTVGSPNNTVATFDSGIIAVRDFVCVELSPKVTSTATLFSPFRHAHVVKLVTDPWSDIPDAFGYSSLS
ncbi:hypothetical protein V5O48_005633 [Marasmius crinis-equi]|uniref:Uncharacterized protein n=1 Tax=Marasmius crinis-equi TaxID=585013 RepID=A0ABR3FLR0_9AGAR